MVHGCGDTRNIWERLIRRHENLTIVVSGHVHAEARRTDDNDFGKPVHQILADYQDAPNGGQGWLRIMRFEQGAEKVHVRTYSPYLRAEKTDDESQFTMDMAPKDQQSVYGTPKKTFYRILILAMPILVSLSYYMGRRLSKA